MGGKRDETAEERSKRKEKERTEAKRFLETMYMPALADPSKTAAQVVDEVVKRGASRKLVRTMTMVESK